VATGGAELRGADNLVRTLRSAAGALEDLTEAEHAAGQLLAAHGSARAPRRTGLLASRHGYTVVDTRLTVTAATPYAAVVHARFPWLTQTLAADEDQVTDLYLDGVDDALSLVKGT